MLSLHPGHRTGTAEHHRIHGGNLSLHPDITDKPGPFCDGLRITGTDHHRGATVSFSLGTLRCAGKFGLCI